MNDDIERVLYSQEDIAAAVKRLGKQLSNDYRDKKPLVVCVLTGAVLFMSDIIRQMDIYLDIDFVDVSSYKGGTASTGKVELIRDLDSDVSGRDIIFVEDIIDTGRTLQFLEDLVSDRGANSIKVCTIFDKPEGRVVSAKADYVGFNVPNEFIVGYGLDYKGFYRNLPYIGILKPSIYSA